MDKSRLDLPFFFLSLFFIIRVHVLWVREISTLSLFPPLAFSAFSRLPGVWGSSSFLIKKGEKKEQCLRLHLAQVKTSQALEVLCAFSKCLGEWTEKGNRSVSGRRWPRQDRTGQDDWLVHGVHLQVVECETGFASCAEFDITILTI